ncbi:MAG TPA: ATP-binding protein, partial [Solirubrobacteraceae bacterium]|nr:ATP-binding protein [Solirubrobacteraceae bacterium]
RASHERLLASERGYRELFRCTPLPMFAYDRATLEILAASDAAIDAYGYSREELLGMTMNDIRPPEDVPRFLGFLDATAGPATHGESPLEPWRHQCKDGRIVDVEIHSDDLTLAGRSCRVAVCHDVSERNRAEYELARSRADERRRAARRSRMLSNLSHELRTPMNGVLGLTEALLESGLSAQQRLYAEQVETCGRRMLTIVNDLLDIAQIETGHAELDVDTIQLHNAIERVCAVGRRDALAKQLGFALRIDEDVPVEVCADEQRLRKALTHLVANAVKFTRHGRVDVNVTTRSRGPEQVVRIEISDTGIGIDPDVLESLFGAFVQADSSPAREHDGAGLGLAIARAFMQLMGGDVGASSVPGLGSVFWAELPTGAPAPGARERIPAIAAMRGMPLRLVAPRERIAA